MVYNFAAILCLQYMVHVMINVMYCYTKDLNSTCAVFNVAVGVDLRLLAFPVCCADIFWIILWWPTWPYYYCYHACFKI